MFRPANLIPRGDERASGLRTHPIRRSAALPDSRRIIRLEGCTDPVDSVPFAEERALQLPLKKYRVTFLPQNVTVEVDPARIPYGRLGKPGSILDVSALAGSRLALEHVCGGVCACATCHVKIRRGFECCSVRDEDELEMLELADDREPVSRLACQCVPDGNTDLIVEIPGY